MRERIAIGILFSTEGPYKTVSRAMRDGALLALEEVNADPAYAFELYPHLRDPRGELSAYGEFARELLRDEGIKHVVGCYTSSSRKDIIPSFEKYDALLWYPSHYEGFETNDNVIYTGAVPNHHVLPLMDHVLREVGSDIYCVGANYVWAWENNRIVRELTLARRGRVVGERYLQVDDLEVGRIVDEIRARRPAFVLNMLIGESSYAFYRAFARAKRDTPGLKDALVGSCTLCEPELAEIGPHACAGHLSSSVYFSTIRTESNRRFLAAYARRYGADARPGADAEASYNTVHLLARALSGADASNIDSVKASLYGVSFVAPQGEVRVDPENNHSYLTPRLGVSRADASFDIIYQADGPVRPDPYLVWSSADGGAKPRMGPATPLHPNITVIR